MPKTPRERMVETATLLIREHGIEATSFSDVVVASGAPRGSIYHYFPRGKAQLIEEATKHGADFIVLSMERALTGGDTAAALEKFAEFYYALARDFDYEAGCPLMASALEGSRTPGARDAAADGFERWELVIAQALDRDGVKPDQAAAVATLAVSSMEGALAMVRAKRSTKPFETVIAQLTAVIHAAIPAS
jgi:AcrR family transcriptional regulator